MEKPPLTLDLLLDDSATAYIPMLRSDGPVSITVRAIESAGIWIENEHICFGEGVTHAFMQCWGGSKQIKPLYDLPPTVLFIPWQQIVYILRGDGRDDGRDNWPADILPFLPKLPVDQNK